MEKRCTKCEVVKQLEEFYNNKVVKDGKTSQCKECIKEYKREFMKDPENKEKQRKYFEKFKENNPLYMSEKYKEHYYSNLEFERARAKQYYYDHTEKMRENSTKCQKENPERFKELRKRWEENNVDKRKEYSRKCNASTKEYRREYYKQYYLNKKKEKEETKFL